MRYPESGRTRTDASDGSKERERLLSVLGPFQTHFGRGGQISKSTEVTLSLGCYNSKMGKNESGEV